MDIFLFVQSAQIFFLVISLSFPTQTKTAAQKAAVLYYKIQVSEVLRSLP